MLNSNSFVINEFSKKKEFPLALAWKQRWFWPDQQTYTIQGFKNAFKNTTFVFFAMLKKSCIDSSLSTMIQMWTQAAVTPKALNQLHARHDASWSESPTGWQKHQNSAKMRKQKKEACFRVGRCGVHRYGGKNSDHNNLGKSEHFL